MIAGQAGVPGRTSPAHDVTLSKFKTDARCIDRLVEDQW